MLIHIYTLVILIIFCNNTQQQQNEIPQVACPNYFQYFHDGSQFFGRITLPNVGDNVDLGVNFTQRTQLRMSDYGQIIPESKQPLRYRVVFLTPNEVPKLTKITVNGQDICSSNDYPAPSINFYLNLRTTTIQLNKPQLSFQPETFSQFLQPPVTNEMYPNDLQEFAQAFQQVTKSPKKNQQVNNRQSVSSPAESFKQPTPQNGECGKESRIAGFVFGGDELSRGEFPWLTAVYYIQDSSLKFLCGGSLVSPRTVVSAGHCVKKNRLSADRLVVHLGRYNLEDFSDKSYVTRHIEKLIVHPDYDPDVFPDADLAILHLQSSVQYTNYIRPICLWTESSDLSRLVGQTGVVAGWGADETGRPTTPIPKKVNTNIVSDNECRKSSATYNSLVSERTFCAGNRDGTGPCIGDSGSGLMINRNDRWYLRGVVSAGLTKQHTCDVHEFVIFCDVAKHLQWVQNQMVS